MHSLSEMKHAINAELIENAKTDPAFRKALLENPRAAIEKKFGVSLSPDIELKVVEESARTSYVVLPAVGGELSDADLEAVTGGFGVFQVLQGFMDALRARAQSNGEIQKELARFR